jgi:hypothetical protein
VLLLEIAAQGIAGAVPASGRAALRGGYNVVSADGAALRQLLEALFYGTDETDELARRAARGAPLRAGLTLTGDDGLTYRLVRDFRGAARLQRYDAAARSFELLSAEPAVVAAHLRTAVGVPPRDRLTALLAVSAAELPSGRGLGRGPPRAAAPQRPDPARARARVEALRAELGRSADTQELQARLDALQTRLFKSEEALREGGRVREALAAAEGALTALDGVAQAERLLGDPAARLQASVRADARRAEALAKAAAGRAAADAAVAPPLRQVRGLWGGLGAGAAVIAAAAAGGRIAPQLRYLALLDVPAFGWAAWSALRWIGQRERAERAARRRRQVDEFERKAQDAWERETAPVRAALAAAGLRDAAELHEALGRLNDARAAAEDARRRSAAWEASPEVGDAREARGRLEEEIRDVETRLAGAAAGFAREARVVQAEIERAEAELRAAEEPEPAPPAWPEAPPAPRSPEPLRALLAAAAAELGGDPAVRVAELAERAGHLAAGFSGQRLSLVLDGGALRVVSGGRAEREVDAAPADRDLLFLAARVAVLERALAAGGAVALADDAFAALPEATRRLAARLLKHAARSGQIVHATSDRAFLEAADHVAG